MFRILISQIPPSPHLLYLQTHHQPLFPRKTMILTLPHLPLADVLKLLVPAFIDLRVPTMTSLSNGTIQKLSHRKHRSPGRQRQDQYPNANKDKASPMEQLALKMKQLMRILKQPKPDGTDPNTWYRQQIYQGLQMLQEMILKVHTRLPKSQHKQGVRTIASLWTFHPQPPIVDDGAESDATVDDPLF